MKHKNTSLAALLAVLVVMSVTTTVFATSAPEGKEDHNPGTGLVAGREVSTVMQDVLAISQGLDGERYFSLDGGESWMSEDRYQAQYGDWGGNWDVEWWTYDEYKAWLENEKKELAGIIGARGYTSGKGWFVWDQEMVDETIAMYQETLEHIKNGGLYSKSITDPNGAVVEGAVLSSGTLDKAEAFAVEMDDDTAVDYTREARRQKEDTENLLKSYQAFGVTGNETDGLYYNGQLIRHLVDGYSTGDGCAIRYVYTNEDGVVDVHTLREEVPLPGGGVDPGGPLTAIVKAGSKGYNPGLFDCLLQDNVFPQQAEALGSSSGGGRTLAEIFAAYEQWGLRYAPDAEDADILTYNGKPAAGFADLKPDGSAFSYSNPYAEDGLRVYTEYGRDGTLTGLTAP